MGESIESRIETRGVPKRGKKVENDDCFFLYIIINANHRSKETTIDDRRGRLFLLVSGRARDKSDSIT